MPVANDAPPKKRKPRKIALDEGVGAEWRVAREAKGLSADELGRRVGVSNGTVSNVELGKQLTLPAQIYLRWRRLLFGKSAEPSPVFEAASDELSDLDDEQMNEVREFAILIKKRKKPR